MQLAVVLCSEPDACFLMMLGHQGSVSSTLWIHNVSTRVGINGDAA